MGLIGGNLALRAGLALSFSVTEAMRLMAAVPEGVAVNVWRARCTVMHGHFRDGYDSFSKHPVVHRAPQEQARLLRSMARCVQDARFAEMCRDHADHLVVAEDRLTEEGKTDEAITVRALALGMPMEWMVQLWRLADVMSELRARQKAWGENHHRIARALKSARIPLWVVAALDEIPLDDLRSMTPRDLVSRAGRSEGFLTEAARVLDSLRILALLGVEPAAWNTLLDILTACLEAEAEIQASCTAKRDVLPRLCRPPGQLLRAEPRAPRAPGPAIPRSVTVQGRRRLHRAGGCGGRLTA
ncbi:hypothetical protein HUT19_33120 [Streptomyces sp. NA02950]|uniref:hypothetical protein n=1 Tax=Streptomyces sp. NA02950 TaxID=2742137 RepID=UPI001591A977|nr:hypothetical protein [Streptomyces sp. NA02950]QKV95980.1 hypothetical protein HUT19_33120 [Streptomyces sp. NA02950]